MTVTGPDLTKLAPAVLRQHDVLVGTDNAFQQRARLLQALWREARGLPVGEHRGLPLGSTLELTHAKESSRTS